MTTAKLPEDLKIRQLARIRDDLNRLRSEQVLLTAVGLHAMVVGSLITLRSCRILTDKEGRVLLKEADAALDGTSRSPGLLAQTGRVEF